MNRDRQNTGNIANQTGASSRPVFITALITALAASQMGGCSTNNTSTRFTYSKDFRGAGDAQRATATIDPDGVMGRFTQDHYQQNAAQIALPERWLSEAQRATAENEARRAAAQAALVGAGANESQALAEADSFHQDSETAQQIGGFESGKMREVYTAKLRQFEEHANARALAADTDARHQTELLAAQVIEWNGQVNKVRAQAQTDWDQSQSEHGRMLAERRAVDDRGQAQLTQMTTIAEMTRARANSQVQALRSESESITSKTAAQADELTQKLKTVSEQTQASLSELHQKIASVGEEGSATTAELRARAKALEEQDIEETYRLSIKEGEANFERQKAESERLFQSADAMTHQVAGELERRRSEADKQMEMDRNDYESSLASIRSFVDHGKADVAVRRVQAMQVEKNARSEFVKNEAEARSNAVREQSRQQFVLAEEEARRIRAEAEAEATRIRSAFVEAFAQKVRSGQVDMQRDFSNPASPKPNSNDPTPKLTKAGERNPVVEPEHVARFKAALAEAEKLRFQTDADERTLFATAEERASAFEAWWRQQQTKHETSLAQATGFESQANADIAKRVSEAEGRMKQASIDLDRARALAEASRRDTLASIVNMRAEGDLIEKKTDASLNQLNAQALATERNGASEIRSLQVILASTRQRGEATAKKLAAEGSSLERAQNAVYAQMTQEIGATRQILESELARLDQAADTFITVAKATFDEALAMGEALARVAEANTTERVAANQAEHQIAKADVQYLRDLNGVNQLVADASVARMVADTNAQFGQASAQELASRASITAEAQIAGAATNAQFAIANAQDDAVNSRFNSRIALTQADRNRAFAQQYLDFSQNRARTQQALAAAKAYREMSEQAVAKLDNQNKSFEIAAKQNWFSGLAMPEPFPTPDSNSNLNTQARNLLNGPAFTDVPTNDNN